MRFIAVTGALGAGKTSSMERFAAMMRTRGLSLGGVLQVSQRLPSGRRAYLARSLITRDSALVAMVGGPGMSPIFFPEGFAWAADRILAPAEVCVIDELGWMEADGRGHWPAVQQLLRQERSGMLLVAVRQDLLERFSRILVFEDVWRVYRGKKPPLERWVEHVVASLGTEGREQG